MTSIREPKDWQLKIWRLAESTMPKSGRGWMSEGEIHDAMYPNLSYRHSHYHTVAEWLTARTQEQWDTALQRVVVALISDDRPYPETSAQARAAAVARSKKHAAALFCASLGLSEKEVIENG